jgi:hypothetical protein
MLLEKGHYDSNNENDRYSWPCMPPRGKKIQIIFKLTQPSSFNTFPILFLTETYWHLCLFPSYRKRWTFSGKQSGIRTGLEAKEMPKCQKVSQIIYMPFLKIMVLTNVVSVRYCMIIITNTPFWKVWNFGYSALFLCDMSVKANISIMKTMLYSKGGIFSGSLYYRYQQQQNTHISSYEKDN